MEDVYRMGRRIRAFRKLKGYTQESFAQALGVSISLIGDIERGNRVADEKLLKKIVALLQIDEEEITGGD